MKNQDSRDSVKTHILDGIKNKKSIIGIIGLGYVGLPLALRFSQSNYRVIGFDVDAEKVSKVNLGQSYIKHILSEDIACAVNKGLVATSEFSKASDVDVLIICVPTPLNKYREPDISYILDSVTSILPFIKKGQLISLESTTYPGTTEEELVPKIEEKGWIVGEDIFVVFSPEREDPGNERFSTKTIPKICGGHTPGCLEVGVALYGSVIDTVIPVSSTRAAEMTKLLENIHRSVNIGLVNEMKIVADKMDIDIHEVIAAAASKPFGFVPYHPGPGLGGHCIPIDPFYLTWKAREYGLSTKFIELAGEVNAGMPDYVVSKVVTALNSNGTAVNGSRILILGLAYKKNIEDTRESPALAIIERLFNMGATLKYSDPFVPSYTPLNKFLSSKGVELNSNSFEEYDCVVLVTDHDIFPYDLILQKSKLIVDSRGRFDKSLPNVIHA